MGVSAQNHDISVDPTAPYLKDKRLPAFVLNTIDGREITNKQLPTNYKYIALIFFSPDCSHCETEAANINTNQLWLSLGGSAIKDRKPRPGQLLLNKSISASTIQVLQNKGYQIKTEERTSGPITAILFDKRYRTLWGGSSNHGEDYGIAG